jgi:thiol-disulfide isomerase/thioredoxin
MTLSSCLRLVALGLSAALLGAVGFLAYEHWGATAVPPATVPLPGSSNVNSLASGPQVPEVRPDFTLHDLTGAKVMLSQWRGKALVINFWATWCGPCQREIPLLNRMQAEYGPRGVQLLGIAVDFAEDVRQFVAKKPLKYPTWVGEEDGEQAARAFGIDSLAFPFTAFTDRQGRVLTVHLGELHEPELRLILEAIVAVDAGNMTLEAARAKIAAAQNQP